MRILTSALLISAVALTACGAVRDSRVNPANWFGKSRSAPIEVQEANTNPLIPAARTGLFAKRRADRDAYFGNPIDQVTGLVIERVPGGAIVRATGLTKTQGVHGVQLTPQTDDETPVDGVLTYRLEGIQPSTAQSVGSEHTRTVVAARALTDQDLRDVRTIRVVAARNARTSRRR
ncbi:MAG: hypothetical protein P8Q26_08295 [Ascidiaceihabitans sp.]|nr:hypothetical protein [Ascidiaceihabitans sp.]